MPTGTFAFRACCLATASESASCFVSAIWATFCSWPLPPHPDQHLELPSSCEGSAVWSVLLTLDAFALPLLFAVWVAELEPPRTSPPAMPIGVLAFRASCLALASASAFCLVRPNWITFCSCPLPPQPDQ